MHCNQKPVLILKKQKISLFTQKGFSLSKKDTIDAVCIGSVVPELDGTFRTLSQTLFNTVPLFVSTRLTTGIANLSETESGLGADRLSDIVAALTLYSGNRIVIDLGTASKFEAISAKDEYVGGAIGPGVGTSFDALIANASKLGDMQLKAPQKVVGGFTTEEHLNSGFIHGFASMIDGMSQRIRNELSWTEPTIILTGGFTDLISPFLYEKIIINKKLVLEGLRILWERNTK